MPLFLHKLLPIFVLPLGFSILLMLAAFVFRKRILILLALIILYVFSTPFVADRLLQMLESQHDRILVDDAEAVDAVVVLGGVGHTWNKKASGMEWGPSVDRFEAAVNLYHAKKTPIIVFTMPKMRSDSKRRSEGEDLRDAAIARGVPPEAILLTGDVRHTADEADQVAKMTAERGWSRLYLVTSAAHMPRASFLFEKANVPFTPFAVDFNSGPISETETLDFVPKAEALSTSESSLREMYGYLYYRLLKD